MREAIRDRNRLEHIILAIARIKRFIAGTSFDDFVGSTNTMETCYRYAQLYRS